MNNLILNENVTMSSESQSTDIQRMLNDKYGVDERIIALLSSEDARKAFNNLKPKNKKNRIGVRSLKKLNIKRGYR